jgi:ribonuclease HII
MPRGRPRLREPHPDRTADLFGSELACDPWFFENRAREAGFSCIAGLDEAGRGPLAGPVVAAAVVLPQGLLIPGLTDSKQVPEPERERLFEVIRERAVCYGIGAADERPSMT